MSILKFRIRNKSYSLYRRNRRRLSETHQAEGPCLHHLLEGLSADVASTPCRFPQSVLPFSSTMCKAFLVRHTCNHASSPRVEKCPTKTRFGECKGVKRIEVKSPTLCATCTAGISRDHHPQQPTPSAKTRAPAMESRPTARKKMKTYDWMNAANKPSQQVNPVEVQTQMSARHKSTPQTKRAITTKTDAESLAKADEKKTRQAEARARNAAKKRDFQEALDSSFSKPAPKKQKPDPTPKATSKPDSPASRWDLVLEETQSVTALPSPPPTLTSLPVKKPQKRAPPKRLELQDSNTAPKLRKTTSPVPDSVDMTPKSKTIASLSNLAAGLTRKLRSLGCSPALLHSTLFSPAEIARLNSLMSAHSDSQGLRRSPRLAPEARAEVFLNKLGRQIGGFTSPRGVKGAEESPNQDELEAFERALMESPNPRTLEGGPPPSRAMGSGRGGGLFESSESEEE
jgi:hypothetical protein